MVRAPWGGGGSVGGYTFERGGQSPKPGGDGGNWWRQWWWWWRILQVESNSSIQNQIIRSVFLSIRVSTVSWRDVPDSVVKTLILELFQSIWILPFRNSSSESGFFKSNQSLFSIKTSVQYFWRILMNSFKFFESESDFPFSIFEEKPYFHTPCSKYT